MRRSTKNILKLLLGLTWSLLCLLGCKKQDEFLDAKSQESDIVPVTLEDFQAVMDNSGVMNTNYTTLGQTGADNYSVTDANYGSLQTYEKNSCLWLKEIFAPTANDVGYTTSYLIVRNSNIVLEGLGKIGLSATNAAAYHIVEGHARFVRAFMFFNLLNVYAKQYQEATAATDPGIPLRTFSDINILVGRSSVKTSYDFIINELKLAAEILPVNALVLMRPSKPAAYALLAKVYLQKGDYSNASKCCDSVLRYKSQLLDFNDGTLVTSTNYRFPAFNKGNPEILYYAEGTATLTASPNTSYNVCFAETGLYNSYSNDDLRKTTFYNLINGVQAKFQGAYTGNRNIFSGLALNEVLLMRAECRARLNDLNGCLADINGLLKNRYKTNTYTDNTAATPDSALVFVLNERRKELPNTGQVRWEDLRRLNLDSRFARTLTRINNGITYTLPPGDPRYVFPFTAKIIQQEGLQQNER